MNMKELFTKKLHWLILVIVLFNLCVDYIQYQEQKQQKLSDKPNLEKRVTVLKEKIEQAKIFQQDLEASKKRVEEVASQIEQVQRQLPNSISDTDILQFFSEQVSELKIRGVSQEALREEARGFYSAKKYRFQAIGTYLQFLIFFERLAQSERLFNVTSLTIKESAEKQKGRFQLVNLDAVIETFRYNSEKVSNLNKVQKTF